MIKISQGLDDLLTPLGENLEGKNRVHYIYVPDEREEDLVSEQIDERICSPSWFRRCY